MLRFPPNFVADSVAPTPVINEVWRMTSSHLEEFDETIRAIPQEWPFVRIVNTPVPVIGADSVERISERVKVHDVRAAVCPYLFDERANVPVPLALEEILNVQKKMIISECSEILTRWSVEDTEDQVVQEQNVSMPVPQVSEQTAPPQT